MANDPSLDPYARTFARYVQQGVALMLERVQQTPGLLPDDLRSQALHTLSFAFPLPAAWPLTRDLLLAMAPKMEQAGHREDWMPYLERGLIQSKRVRDDLAYAELAFQIAILARMVSQFELANQSLAISLATFCSLADQRGQARSLNELAWVAYLQNHYSIASHYIEQALCRLENPNDSECGMSYRVQGMIAIELGDYQSAEYCHRRSLAIFEENNDQRRIAWCLQNLANTLRNQAKYSEAITYYEQALAMMLTIWDIHNIAIVQFNLGVTYHRSGNDEEAIRYFQQAIEVFTKLNNKLFLAKINCDLGLSNLCIQKYPEAMEAFLTSIQLFRELQESNWRLNAMDGLAMCYLAQRQYEKAEVILEAALAELPSIINAPNYNYLVLSLKEHLQEAKQQRIHSMLELFN